MAKTVLRRPKSTHKDTYSGHDCNGFVFADTNCGPGEVFSAIHAINGPAHAERNTCFWPYIHVTDSEFASLWEMYRRPIGGPLTKKLIPPKSAQNGLRTL